jgi:hypothetical protein
VRKKKIRTFKATGTSGKVFTIEHWQDQIPAPSFEDPNGVIEGQDSLVTGGQPVNYISKGKYLIVATGEELTAT